jgi:hypothetical protein
MELSSLNCGCGRCNPTWFQYGWFCKFGANAQRREQPQGGQQKAKVKNKYGRDSYQTSLGARTKRRLERQEKQEMHHQKVMKTIYAAMWAPPEDSWDLELDA